MASAFFCSAVLGPRDENSKSSSSGSRLAISLGSFSRSQPKALSMSIAVFSASEMVTLSIFFTGSNSTLSSSSESTSRPLSRNHAMASFILSAAFSSAVLGLEETNRSSSSESSESESDSSRETLLSCFRSQSSAEGASLASSPV